MERKRTRSFALFFACLFLLASCTSSPAAPTAAPEASPSPTVQATPEPTATPEPAPAPTATPTATPTPTPTATPAPAPTPTPTPKPDECVIVEPPPPPPLVQDECCLPPFPHLFIGHVFIDGKPAPDGMYVWATIGEDYQTNGVRVKNGRYLLAVGPLHPKYYGQKIEFYVNGVRVEGASAIFTAAMFEEHDGFDLSIDDCSP